MAKKKKLATERKSETKSGKKPGTKSGKAGSSTGQSTQEVFDMISALPELADLAAADDPLFRQVLEKLGGSLDEIVDCDDSPMGRALDVLYEAQEATPKRQLQAARKALKICPQCVEAHGMLGDLAATDEESLAHYQTAVETGWRNLGKDPRQQFGEHFWLALETRPFMAAKRNLANFLWETGDVAAAIEHYRELLEFNPNDNQGVRYELANCLLREDRRADLRELLERYDEDASAEFAYSAALLAFREQGDTPHARKLLRAAKRSNKHVIAYLVGKDELPFDLPEYITVGGKDEAVSFAAANLRNWTETDGAVPWIRKVLKLKVVEPGKTKRAPQGDRWMRIAADLPQSEDEVWQIDAVQMEDFAADDPNGAPWMAAIVRDDDGLVVNFDLNPDCPSPDELLAFVLQAMSSDDRREPSRPAAIEVRRQPLYSAWTKPMNALGIDLILCDELPTCDEALRESSQGSLSVDRLASVLSDAAEGNLPSPNTLSQATGEFWLADIRSLATWLEDGGSLIRPMMAMIVDTTNEALLMQDVVIEDEVDDDRLWRVLSAAMHSPQEGEPRRPGRIGFRTSEFVDRFGPRLADIGIDAAVCEDLGPIDFMADELGRRMCGPEAPPALVDVPGMTNEHLLAFFDSAATFRQNAVWRGVPSDAMLRVDRVQPAGPSWFGVVMGQSGMTYGLALYESLDDLLRLMSGAITSNEEAARTSALSMTFGEAFDISPRDLEAQEQHGWPVVGKQGYPTITRVNQGGSMRPPLVWELELMTTCLAALPEFRYRVGTNTTASTPTGNGEVTLRLHWLDELDG